MVEWLRGFGERALTELTFYDFEFIGNTWLLDEKRVVVDEELFITGDREYFLWIDWIWLSAYLFKRINGFPGILRLMRLNPPFKHKKYNPYGIDVFVSEPDQKYILIRWNGEKLRYVRCASTNDLDSSGIPVRC